MTHWLTSLRFLALATVCAALLACGSRVNQANFDKVEAGMTQAEVEAILGSPSESTSASFGNISGGSATWKSDDAVITVQFVNNKVQFKQYAKAEEE